MLFLSPFILPFSILSFPKFVVFVSCCRFSIGVFSLSCVCRSSRMFSFFFNVVSLVHLFHLFFQFFYPFSFVLVLLLLSVFTPCHFSVDDIPLSSIDHIVLVIFTLLSFAHCCRFLVDIVFNTKKSYFITCCCDLFVEHVLITV